MNEFTLSEFLFRKIGNNPNMWKNGQPSSAVFKDSKGCSVDRDGGRESAIAVESIVERFGVVNISAVVSVTIGDCDNCSAIVKYVPIEDNLYHSEIHKNAEVPALSGGQAKRLATCCKVVYPG